MKQLILIPILLLLLSSYTLASDGFSNDPDEFFKQLAEQMEQTNRDDAKEAVKAFTNAGRSGNIPEVELQRIIKLMNVMKAKRMRNHPHFNNYIQAINSMVTTEQFTAKFPNWQVIVEGIADKAVRGSFVDFDNFLKFSLPFIADNVLYKTRTKTWKAELVDYEFIPDAQRPGVTITETSLYLFTPKDSLFIYNTKGNYYPLESLWEGSSGKVTWERVDKDPNNVYAEIGKYNIDFTKNGYTAANVLFHHKKYFKVPIEGILVDKISAKVDKSYLYPQFDSYDTNIKVDNFAPQVKFEGGFGLHGFKVVGFGKDEKKATITLFSNDDRRIMSAKSMKFGIKEARQLNSINTSVAVYFANDSIYHPSLNLKYVIPTKELRLVRDNKASSKIAFMSSYHKLEANIDALLWDLDKPFIDFEMVTQLKNKRVAFESFNLYEAAKIDKYLQLTDLDVLSALKGYIDAGQFTVGGEEFAKYMNPKYTISSVLGTIFDLVEDGFIYYDVELDRITIRDKTLKYFQARREEIDYDRIMLLSVSDDENAQLDLETKKLLVTGLSRIILSDKQRVYLHPLNGITQVKKNRDMDMNGSILSGYVDFSGKNFHFNYDPFTINCDTIQHMQLYIDNEPNTGAPADRKVFPVKTLIQDVKGTLYIDKEDNKSGKEDYADYPKFVSDGQAHIYYDSDYFYRGAYKRDTFYFLLDPFTFKDLDIITKEDMIFAGEMHPSNIFPPFKQEISLQPDYTLGFSKDTGLDGMPTYEKGMFTGSVSMNEKGFRGNGELVYMASNMTSDNFIFFPDSMLVSLESFSTKRMKVGDIPFPPSSNTGVKVKWLPKLDSMIVKMGETPFSVFNDRFSLKGNLVLTDKGMEGKGAMMWDYATIQSPEFRFEEESFRADSSDVIIRSEKTSRGLFNSYNVKSMVDVSTMTGRFEAREGVMPIVLPYNQYKTYADKFFWKMEENEINVRLPENTDTVFFESMHPRQGGLKFRAGGGLVNLDSNTVKVDGIPYINVADAKIVPYSGRITILPNAKIEDLLNATIVVDSTTEYHKITDARVVIKNINEFSGNGKYTYRGKGIPEQVIEFDQIESIDELKSEQQKKKDKDKEKGKGADAIVENKEKKKEVKGYFTYGSTSIPEDQKFKLNNRIEYKGDAIIDSRSKYLVFDGFAKIGILSNLESNWFKFKDDINPENIQIDVSTPIGERLDTLSFGLVYDMDTLGIYATFLSSKRTPLDIFVFDTKGELEYDADKNIYRVGDLAKLNGEKEQGNVYILKDSEQKVDCQGRINLGKFGLARVDASGFISHDIKTGHFDFSDVLVGFDFTFDETLLDKIGQTVRDYSYDEEIDYTKEEYLQAAIELLDEKDIPDFKKTIGQYGYLPEKVKGLDQTITLTDLNMVYDSTNLTIRSLGQFGLSYSGNKYVNRMVNGYVEFGLRNRKSDFFNLYIETDEDEDGSKEWFFFNYKKGQMRALSSDPDFNKTIMETKEKKRRTEDKKTGMVYEYTRCPTPIKNDFLARMRMMEPDEVEEKKPPRPRKPKPKVEKPKEETPIPSEDEKKEEEKGKKEKKDKKAKDKQDKADKKAKEEEEKAAGSEEDKGETEEKVKEDKKKAKATKKDKNKKEQAEEGEEDTEEKTEEPKEVEEEQEDTEEKTEEPKEEKESEETPKEETPKEPENEEDGGE